MYLLLLLERKKEVLEFFVFGHRHWFNAPPHSKWHFKNPLKKKRRQDRQPDLFGALSDLSLSLSLSVSSFFGSLLRTSVGQARLHSVSVSVSNVSLRQSWFDPDTDTATATQVQLQIQKRAIQHRYFSGPRQFVWHVVCTDAFKIVSFSMEMLQIFHEKHLYCIHNSFVLFFSLSFSLSLFLTRSLSFSKQSSDHYSSLKVLIVHCTANPRASCNISINNKDFAPGTGIPFGPLIPTLSLGITVCPA